ncbi:MAG: glycoside hydrolase family 1 protein [Burkholderiales bacterium]
MPFMLKDDMQLGVASAATQIEGGNRQNSWYDWYLKGHIKDGSDPSVANMHYERFAEDAQIMHDMGIKHYRLGIEWARLEPERGVFNEAEFRHYREELMLLKQLGIEPLLTIHHFTNPLWFENIGAFENRASVGVFLDFVKKVVEEFGDIVAEYITINEPNVYAVFGFFFGDWPPGRKSLRATIRVLNNMRECHIKAYELIHSIRRGMGREDTKVSYAHHMRVFEPKNRANLWHRICTSLMRRVFQESISKSFLKGQACFPLRGCKRGLYCDFHAINYYSRSAVAGFKDEYFSGVPVNDLGWEIYPDGIVQNARELYKLARLPIYITENGTCDNADAFRSRYIYEHLKALAESELPVKRYYHWCFTDNFEWLEGFSARFGIVHVDYSTQKRTVKRSGEFFSRMIENRGVTKDMYDEYCAVEYKTNAAPQKP